MESVVSIHQAGMISVRDLRGQILSRINDLQQQTAELSVSGAFNTGARAGASVSGDLGILGGIIMDAILAGPIMSLFGANADMICAPFADIPEGSIVGALQAWSMITEDDMPVAKRDKKDVFSSLYPKGRKKTKIKPSQKWLRKEVAGAFNAHAANQNTPVFKSHAEELAWLHEALDRLEKYRRSGIDLFEVSDESQIPVAVYENLRQNRSTHNLDRFFSSGRRIRM